MSFFTKKKVKWILLDAMGVVYKVGDDTNELLIPYIRSKNDGIDPNEINSRYLETSLGAISSAMFWELLGFKAQFPDIEIGYLENFVKLDEDVLQFLKQVRKKGFNTAMLSNDISEWSSFLRMKFDKEKQFNQVIISGDVKIRKPDIEIFCLTLLTLNANPKNCLFVDDRERNLETAFNLGFNTVYFKRTNNIQSMIANMEYIDFYVSNFKELELILERHFELC